MLVYSMFYMCVGELTYVCRQKQSNIFLSLPLKLVSDTTSTLCPSACNHTHTHTHSCTSSIHLSLMHFSSDLLPILVYKGTNIKQCSCRYFTISSTSIPGSYLSCPSANRQEDKRTLSCQSNCALVCWGSHVGSIWTPLMYVGSGKRRKWSETCSVIIPKNYH